MNTWIEFLNKDSQSNLLIFSDKFRLILNKNASKHILYVGSREPWAGSASPYPSGAASLLGYSQNLLYFCSSSL